MTRDEYLAFENQSAVRHEYVAGEVYAMTGGTRRHNLITLNIAGSLKAPARARGCHVFATAVKVSVDDRVYYPDVVVACDRMAGTGLFAEQPAVIVEVTSPSSRATDRREKLEAYRRLASLHVYLIVSQRRRQVLAYLRGPDDAWARTEFTGNEVIPLPMLSSQLALDAIYDAIELPPLAVGEGDEEEEEEEEGVGDEEDVGDGDGEEEGWS